MDHRDETRRRMEEIYHQLHSAYCQFNNNSPPQSECFSYSGDISERVQSLQTPKDLEIGLHPFKFQCWYFTLIFIIKDMIENLTMFFILFFLLCFRQKNHPTRNGMANCSSLVQFCRNQT